MHSAKGGKANSLFFKHVYLLLSTFQYYATAVKFPHVNNQGRVRNQLISTSCITTYSWITNRNSYHFPRTDGMNLPSKFRMSNILTTPLQGVLWAVHTALECVMPSKSI